MKVLVTGATGFIGSHLVKRLIDYGHYVRCLVRETSNLTELKKLTNTEFFGGDVTKKNSLKGVMEDIDVVYHLAALRGHDPPSKKAFHRFRLVNVEGTRNILDECIEKNINRFIYISSTAVMGVVKVEKIDENTNPDPYTPYQVSKYEAEKLVKKYMQPYGIPAIIIRPSQIYGPGFKGDFLKMAKVINKHFFPKIGRGKNLSPALYIEDLIDALASLTDKGNIGDTYIISSERSYTIDEIYETLKKEVGKRCVYIYIPKWLALSGSYIIEKICLVSGKEPLVTLRNIQSLTTDKVFCIEKAKNDLLFQQRTSLDVGLKKTVQYFKEDNLI